MKPIQTLTIVVTLICPQARRIFSFYGETAGRPWKERASLLSPLCFFLSPGWPRGHTSLEGLISVPEPGIAMSWICYFKQMNIPRSSKVLLSIRQCKNTAIFLGVSICVPRWSWYCVFSSQTSIETAGTGLLSPSSPPCHPLLNTKLCHCRQQGDHWSMEIIVGSDDWFLWE